MRIGQGYDVHRLVKGRKLIIGGVEIPHDKGLLGHSDADVLLHALADAILGALGLGDIGHAFPDSDPAFLGLDSREVIVYVKKKMMLGHWKIGNIDATILAEQPKLAPYLSQMKEILATLLDTKIEAINIKATTTERLGFIGREEGMAAEVVVLLEQDQ